MNMPKQAHPISRGVATAAFQVKGIAPSDCSCGSRGCCVGACVFGFCAGVCVPNLGQC
jgi:hypothetical protein